MRHQEERGVMLCGAVAISVIISAAPVRASPARIDLDAAVVRLVRQFIAAQRDFDAARMAALMAPDYIEISPIGDLDRRQEVLGFYDPSQKRALPETKLLDTEVKRVGGARLLTARLSFNRVGPDGSIKEASVRASYLAVPTRRGWRLAAAQFTPARAVPVS